MLDETGAPITLLLLGASAVLSVLAFGNQKLFSDLLFEPFVMKARGQWHRFITHAFIHANWPHLAVNMFVLFGFGQHVEQALWFYAPAAPALAFTTLYLGGILFSSLPAYRRHIHDPNYRAVGASGAVSAILFAYILMTPTNTIRFLFIPAPIPAWVFGGLYLVYSWYMDRRGQDNVAHDAHFYGAVFGLVFMIVLDPGIVAAFITQIFGE
jgi:membrane associated rhomboid family serine protease